MECWVQLASKPGSITFHPKHPQVKFKSWLSKYTGLVKKKLTYCNTARIRFYSYILVGFYIQIILTVVVHTVCGTPHINEPDTSGNKNNTFCKIKQPLIIPITSNNVTVFFLYFLLLMFDSL